MNTVQAAITIIREAIQKRIDHLRQRKNTHYEARIDELELLMTHLPEEDKWNTTQAR